MASLPVPVTIAGMLLISLFIVSILRYEKVLAAPLVVKNFTLSWKPRNMESAEFVLEEGDDLLSKVSLFCVQYQVHPILCDNVLDEVRAEVYPDMLYGKQHNASGIADFCHQRPYIDYFIFSEDPLVSVIIPSKGRVHIMDTLKSLDAQTDRDFEAILVLDGVSILDLPVPQIRTNRPYLCIVELVDKQGNNNSAGSVRNAGIQYASGKFVAFLDDDDEWSPDYVERLREEHESDPTMDAVLFRMYKPRVFSPWEDVLPRPDQRTLKPGWVGISYAILRHFFVTQEVQFITSSVEDYAMLNMMYTRGYRIVMSRYVTYFVRVPAVPPVWLDPSISSFVIEDEDPEQELKRRMKRKEAEIEGAYHASRQKQLGKDLRDPPAAASDSSSSSSSEPVIYLHLEVMGRLGNQMFQFASMLGMATMSSTTLNHTASHHHYHHHHHHHRYNNSSSKDTAVGMRAINSRHHGRRVIACFQQSDHLLGEGGETISKTFVMSPDVQFDLCPPSATPGEVIDLKENGYATFDAGMVEYVSERNHMEYTKEEQQQQQGSQPSRTSVHMHISGYLQSFRYFYAIRSSVQQLFTFQPLILDTARNWARAQGLPFDQREQSPFAGIIDTDSEEHREEAERTDTTHQQQSQIVVCIHLRFEHHAVYQYLMHPTSEWYAALLDHLYEDDRTVFVVFSDDFQRAMQVLGIQNAQATDHADTLSSRVKHAKYDIRLARGNSAAVDMALLSSVGMCTDIVLSRGTFGWWAAYLAPSTTHIWYSPEFDLEHPINKGNVNLKDYYPHDWTLVRMAAGSTRTPSTSTSSTTGTATATAATGTGSSHDSGPSSGDEVDLKGEGVTKSTNLLLDIPITIAGEKDSNDVTVHFQWYEGENILESLRTFCQQYGLVVAHCQRLKSYTLHKIAGISQCKCLVAMQPNTCSCELPNILQMRGELMEVARSAIVEYSQQAFHAMVLWGHGYPYLNDILAVIRSTPGITIVRLNYLSAASASAWSSDTLTPLIHTLYQNDIAKHPEHIQAKSAYLHHVASRLMIVVLHDVYPIYAEYGSDPAWKVTANKNLVDLKWKIRRAFNEAAMQTAHLARPSDQQRRRAIADTLSKDLNHNHVVHFTDTTEDALKLFRAFGAILPADPTAYLSSHANFHSPYHASVPEYYSMELVSLKQLRVRCAVTVSVETGIKPQGAHHNHNHDNNNGGDDDDITAHHHHHHQQQQQQQQQQGRTCVQGAIVSLEASPQYDFVQKRERKQDQPREKSDSIEFKASSTSVILVNVEDAEQKSIEDESSYGSYYRKGLERGYLVDDHTEESFHQLVNSFVPSNYGACFPHPLNGQLRRGLIIVDTDYVITDGAHRAALLLSMGLQRVDVIVREKKQKKKTKRLHSSAKIVQRNGQINGEEAEGEEEGEEKLAGIHGAFQEPLRQWQVIPCETALAAAPAAVEGGTRSVPAGGKDGLFGLLPSDIVSLGVRSLQMCDIDFVLVKVSDPHTFPLYQKEASDVDILLGGSPRNGTSTNTSAGIKFEDMNEHLLRNAVVCLQGSFLETRIVYTEQSDIHWQLDVYTQGTFRVKFDLYAQLTSTKFALNPRWKQLIFQHAVPVVLDSSTATTSSSAASKKEEEEEAVRGQLLWWRPCWSDEAAIRYLEYKEWVDIRPDKIKHLRWIQARPEITFTSFEGYATKELETVGRGDAAYINHLSAYETTEN